MNTSLDLRAYFEQSTDLHRCNAMTQGVEGSMILRIAYDIAARKEAGEDILSFTVGDYAPSEFPMPAGLSQAMQGAFVKGETNYAPVAGLPAMRQAVADYYERFFGLSYPKEAVVTTAGSRAVVYSFFRALVAAGDKVINPAPSWNVKYYCALTQAQEVIVESLPEHDFLPRRARLEPHIQGARVLCLCSPSNPVGSIFDKETLTDLCDMVLEENARRQDGERPLFVLYDQVYWPIVHGGRKHLNPVSLRPEMARYTVFVDGISKAFAATGVRVGWGLGPPDLIAGMARTVGHGGAWAPRPLQVGTYEFLAESVAVEAALTELQSRVEERLATLHKGLVSLQEKGHPLTMIEPAGALYLSVSFNILGKSFEGKALETGEDIRAFILEQAGIGIVPFEAFGCSQAETWFRFSVGAVTDDDIASVPGRLDNALAKLS